RDGPTPPRRARRGARLTPLDHHRPPPRAREGRTRHVPLPAPPGRAPLRVESGTETRPVRRRSSARRGGPETAEQERGLAEFIYTMYQARRRWATRSSSMTCP